jgi:purine nucleoside permease
VKLPNGKHVTFAFCPASTPGEVECVDIHTTAGKTYVNGNKATSWQQSLVGFTTGHDTFATRDLKENTGLVTLLLHSKHNTKTPETTVKKKNTGVASLLSTRVTD